jgi:hypothetical protein
MKDKRRTRKVGSRPASKDGVGFEINPYYEQLLEMRETKPAAYKIMSVATRLTVEAYVRAKEAASQHPAIKAAA